MLIVITALACVPAVASGFSITSQRSADDDNNIVMSPANETISTVDATGGAEIGPGMTVERPVVIHNRSDTAKGFSLDVAQVVGTSAATVAETRPGVREGAAAWVTLDRTTFTLKPDQLATVMATIEIPAKIRPGSKPFAVIATQTATAQATGGAGVAPTFTQTAIFIVEIPGDAPVEGRFTKTSVTSAQKNLAAVQDRSGPPVNSRLYVGPGLTGSHQLTLATEYENTGERLLAASGTVTVTDIFGRTAGRYRIEPFRVYPGGAAAGTVALKGLPSLGFFRAKVELESETGNQTKQLRSFFFLPKWFLAVALAGLLWVLYTLVRLWLRRRADWKRYLDDEVEDAADDEEFVEEPDAIV
ncbi:MAG: hypothetical protein JWO69_1851 [Thermoleophilia bacterium]|jgi:hypothetical protein|nr:hypothetical protein [Thermoleophilia bacterium]